MLNAFTGIAQVSNVERTEEYYKKMLKEATEGMEKFRMQKQREECAVLVLEELKSSLSDKVRQLNIKKEEIDNEIDNLNGELETFNDVEDAVKFVELNYHDKFAASINSVALQQLVPDPTITQPPIVQPIAQRPSSQQSRKAQWNGLVDEKQKMFIVYKDHRAEFHKENVGVRMTKDWNNNRCNTRYESANCLVKAMYRDLGATNTPNAWIVIKVMKGTKKVSLGDFVA